MSRFPRIFLILSLVTSVANIPTARGEAMLQYFNTSWAEITYKMPELAEAGYSSLWLPPPTKGSGGLSVGYDLWDPFDLGGKNQRSTVRTRYGTEADLLRLMETAHRFGIRVYFDNIMNHRAFDVPGFNADTPIDIYPGMVPEDFHLRLTEDGRYRKWDNTRDWNSAWQVQNLGLADLIDIAQEPGSTNHNFGGSEGSTFPKIKFLRDPTRPDYYAHLPNGTYVGFGPNNGITEQMLQDNKEFYSERVEDYLNRAARWLMDRTKADGLRLDAVKHVPADFFGATFGADKDTSDYGYTGQVQRQFNLTRGFSDANHRDSVFSSEAGRDDALLFGEHLGQPPGYGPYWDSGMRLVDNDLRSMLNGVLGNPSASLQGLDSPGSGGFAPSLGVMHAQSHDSDYAARRELQHAMYFTRAGIGLLYTDGNYQAETLGESGGAFPRHANTSFLGQWNDPRIPNLLYIHDQFARGNQLGRWSDGDVVVYERIDKRENGGMSDADGVTLLFMLNDNYANGQARNFATSFPATKFGSDAYLYNYSTYGGGFYTWASDLAGVIIPPGGYFAFSWKNPDPSDLWQGGGGSPVTILQNGQRVGTISYERRDGPNGDSTFNPNNLPNRGYPQGVTPKPYTYMATVPRVTDGTQLRFVARADGSAENILMKLDGGIDLNGTRPNTDPGFRDNPPGVSTDTFLGYEQPTFVGRIGPEKFAAINTTRCKFGSAGAETYTGGGNTVNGSGTNPQDAAAATFVFHDPNGGFDGYTPQDPNLATPTQYHNSGSSLIIWAKTNSVGSGFKAFVYYTNDGTNPEGAGGVGIGTTKVQEMFYTPPNTTEDPPNNWWRGAISPVPSGTIKYKIGVYKTGQASQWPGGETEVARKKNMMTVFQTPGPLQPPFNATTKQFFPHNDYAKTPQGQFITQTGLSEGFHVIRARAFLDRPGRASIYNTFTQTFYYDAQRAGGEIKFPAIGDTVGGSNYGVVIRTDPSVTEVWYHIADSDSTNDDANTRGLNGNGAGFEPFTDSNGNGTRDAGEPFEDLNGNGVWDGNLAETWVRASESTPTPSITSAFQKEWRFNYVNIPPSPGNATIRVRLREISSAGFAGFGQSDVNGHYTTLERTVNTAGPDIRMFVAFPQQDEQVVDDTYVMKTYFSKALADGLNEQQLKDRFLIKIGSNEPGAQGVVQDPTKYSIVFNETSEFHALAYTLPNLFNGNPNFIHKIEVTHTRPAPAPVLTSTRLVKAFPKVEPRVSINHPPEFGPDGRPFEIVLPDVPSPTAEQRQYPIRIDTGTDATSVTITFEVGSGTIALDSSTTEDPNPKIEGSSKLWRYTWTNMTPGSFRFRADVDVNGDSVPDASDTRNATVILRQVVTDNPNDDDDDDDGLHDVNENTIVALPHQRVENPKPNPETWTNGDVHIHFAYGRSNPLMPDTDGDGLPDGLEVGWRSSTNPPTDPDADTNGNGWKNLIPDLDPPFYNTLDNLGKVPGVNTQSEGGDRAKQLFGSTTDPNNPDTDGDGVSDGVEDANRNGWVDGDGATIQPGVEPSLSRNWPNKKIDPGETWTETDPTNPDTDGDGLSDGHGEDKNYNGFIDGDTNKNRVYDSGELWTETDPLNADTDGDGLPDGWEVANGLDPLDNGTTNMRTGGAGNPVNGADGDPDGDELTNLQELTNGTNPQVHNEIAPPAAGSIRIGPVPQNEAIVKGAVTNLQEFTDWTLDDLIVLDEYDGDGFNNQGTDLYRGWDGFDSSRDLVAFYARDGGAPASGGDGNFYFRVDLHDLKPFAEQANLDIYVVIDTGNPAVGEYSLPDQVDTGTEMRWEAVVAVYSGSSGRVYVDTNNASNSTAIGQTLTSFGVVARDQNTPNGFKTAYFSSDLDAVEFAISRQALLDAGWAGDPNTLNFQVFTTRDGTGNSPVGAGDIGGRSDIRDTIYDDWIASDYWRDQTNIAGNKSVLKSWFSRRPNQPAGQGSNDRGKRTKVISLIHGNQAILPGSTIQSLINNTAGAGYDRPLDVHEAYSAALAMHITPTLASAIQWAKVDPASPRQYRDGPALNARISALAGAGSLNLIGSTFSDHILPYFTTDFNEKNVGVANDFLGSIYNNAQSPNILWTPERVLDSGVLNKISALGYQYTFADQMRHLFKWFGRTSALSNDGYRVNQINGVKIFPIHDQTSSYRFQNTDKGAATALRELLSRKARSGQQDQMIVLFSNWEDFGTKTLADAYDLNVRWLASRPWVQLVTPKQIANSELDLSVPQDGTNDAWGVVDRGTNANLQKVAHDWIDHATQENYDNWYFGQSGREEGLRDKVFNIRTAVALPSSYGILDSATPSGLIAQSWTQVDGMSSSLPELANLVKLGRGVIGASVFETAFHNQSNHDLTKFSTGTYINPDTSFQTLSTLSKHPQSQTRFGALYKRVYDWANVANTTSNYKLSSFTEQADVDLDGENEYLLYNDRIFAVFERIGGRMIGAWIRNVDNGTVYQVVGNLLSYPNSETEAEGNKNNETSGAISAHRTSGFKDWFVQGAPDALAYVNNLYTVTAASTGTGWTLTSSDGRVSKTVTLAPRSTLLRASYALSGGVTTLFVRHGLSPHLLDLLLKGQQNLIFTTPASEVNLYNGDHLTSSTAVRSFVKYSGEGSNAVHVSNAIDRDNTVTYDTINMRNQAQTQQVEFSLANGGSFALGLQTGSTISADADGDGLPDVWETQYGLNPNSASGNDGAGGDADGDGKTNLQELILGTNPVVFDSGFPRVEISTNGNVTLQFHTLLDRVYRVYFSGDPGGPWQAAGGPITGTGSQVTWVDDGSQTGTPPSNAQRRFYRVDVKTQFNQ